MVHQKFLKESKKCIPQLEIHPPFDLNDISEDNKLRIEDNSIDIVECSIVGHHVENFETFIQEVFRILKKDGLFYYLDLTDKIEIEDKMTFNHTHRQPLFHGIEFFRDYKKIRESIQEKMNIKYYERIGPGILFLIAQK